MDIENITDISAQLALQFINELIQTKIGQTLDNKQTAIFIAIWEDDSIAYKDIAEKIRLSESGVKKAAKRLYGLLNKAIPIPVKIERANIKGAIVQVLLTNYSDLRVTNIKPVSETARNSFNLQSKTPTAIKLESPDRPVPYNSQFYIERENEVKIYQVIAEPGAVIRIIGERKSGATSLVSRIARYAKARGDRLVVINFQGVEEEALSSIKSFMQWFCLEVSDRLEIEECLQDYWRDSRPNSTSQQYFEKYLLKQLSQPAIVIFERIDYFFDEKYADTARVFFALIRSWIDRQSTFDLWEKLKYIIVQGQQEIDMGNKRSPFNVGEEIILNNFSIRETIDLAARHQLNWSEREITKLKDIFGNNIGHPHLIRHVLYRLVEDNLSLENFLKLDFQALEPFKTYLDSNYSNCNID